MCGLVLSASGQDAMAGFCEHSNESSGSKKSGISCPLSDYQIFKNRDP
jgi:hypothetical protein